MTPKLIRKTHSLIEWLVLAFYAHVLHRDYITGFKIHGVPGIERIGSEYGGWLVPVNQIPRKAVCYLVGVGEDITFDLGLIARFDSEVFAFDPTPRAKRHVESHAKERPAFHFYTYGIWSRDEVIRFYAHANPASTSFSITNLHQTADFFEAPCRRLSSIMRELGHQKLDILKLDVEGAEYEVIDSILEDRIDVDLLFVEYDEFHSKRYEGYRERIRASVKKLQAHGYQLVAVKPKCNYTFVKTVAS